LEAAKKPNCMVCDHIGRRINRKRLAEEALKNNEVEAPLGILMVNKRWIGISLEEKAISLTIAKAQVKLKYIMNNKESPKSNTASNSLLSKMCFYLSCVIKNILG